MQKYTSIKQLVIDETLSNGQFPSLVSLTTLVKENFPNSKWDKKHYDWYKSQIKTGKIEINNLSNDTSFEEDVIKEEASLIEFAVSLERDLQNYLSSRLNEIEEGLTLIETEYGTSAGFIDILAKDKFNNHVVIELKAGKAKDAAIGQLLGYIGALIETGISSNIRGILIASDFENRLIYAAKTVSNITLLKYTLNFKFNTVNK
jgi:RecB family endonuclease NucS